MQELTNQELKYVSGAVNQEDLREERKPTQNDIDPDFAWMSLATIVAILFFGSAALTR